MAKKNPNADPIAGGTSIDPDAAYTLQVTARFDFEKTKLGPNWRTEVKGSFLSRLLASEYREKVAGFVKV